jgi:hypothetical protein
MFNELARVIVKELEKNGINSIYFLDVLFCIFMLFEIRDYRKQERKDFRTKSRLFWSCVLALILLGLSIEELCKNGK